jgi:hypothetical protein
MIHQIITSALGGQYLTSCNNAGYKNKSVHLIDLQILPEYRIETKKCFLRISYDRAKTDLCQTSVYKTKLGLHLNDSCHQSTEAE